TPRTYAFSHSVGVVRNTGLSQPCNSGCGANSAATTYDSSGRVASRTDFKGVITTYSYDSRNLEVSRTEAYGTAKARTVTTTWHSTFRLPMSIVEPNRTTSFTYDGNGNVLTR